MNTLLKKDLRENFKLAVIGLIVFSLILVSAYQGCLTNLNSWVYNGSGSNVSALNPLFSDRMLELVMFFCAIYGALLGWLQTRNEAHRDLWAFLIHRPITRTQIFQGKALAGMILYAVGAGLPLLVLMLVVAAPGHIPMPFEWPMLLPLTAIFLTGFAYYFAGMLTGLRQARWYGSRWYGIGAAVIASLMTFVAGEFWQALLATVIATLVLALAAWGAYQSGGFYRGQPRPGQAALSVAMAAGSAVLVLVVVGLFSTLVLDRFLPQYLPSRQYVMLYSGEVCVAAWQDGDWKSIEDLQGHPFVNPKTGRPLTSKELTGERAGSITLNADQKRNVQYNDNYRRTYRFFSMWAIQDKKLWYVDRYGRLVGFDGITRRMIHVLQPQDAAGGTDPDGFARPNLNYGPDYFYHYPGGDPPATLVTRHAVYQIDLQGPSVKRIFTVDTNDEITTYSGIRDNFNNSDQITLATSNTVQLLNADGKSLFKTPYVPAVGEYPSVSVYHLKPDDLALWFNPRDYKKPAHIFWPFHAGQTNQSLELPSLYQPYPDSMLDKIETSLVPPGVFGVSLILSYQHARPVPGFFNFGLLLSCGWSVACVLIGLGMMSRYHFSARTKAVWSVFIFLLGIPGLIALFVTEEWPVREVCPKCQRLRAVDREHCEYCDAEFPAPEKNGTEIFEPLGAVAK